MKPEDKQEIKEVGLALGAFLAAIAMVGYIFGFFLKLGEHTFGDRK